MGASDLMSLAGKEVLSASPGPLLVPVNDRDKVCYTADGTLYIADSYRNDLNVLSYIDTLKHEGIDFRIQHIGLSEIQKLYAHAPTSTVASDASFRQIQIASIVGEAVNRGASDIHWRNEETHTKVLIRVDGYLEELHTLKKEDGEAQCATMYGSMCDVADTTYQRGSCQDGRIKAEYLKAWNLFGARISTRPKQHSNFVVLRLLYNSGEKKSLAGLGYDESIQIPSLIRMTKRTTGINIFSGSTGSGKSTSLDALLSNLMKEMQNRVNLLTIEDPPEYRIDGAVQTPLICDRDDPDAVSREWVRSISSAMRLDPDIMMIGEMRDRDSAQTAFRAAMTGHGVWTTLHANNNFQVLDRLIDIGVPATLAMDASLVTGLINQSLAALNCDQCKRPYSRYKRDIEPGLQQRIETYCDPAKVFLRGIDKGCKHCKGKGIRGRTVVAEVCVPNQKLMNEYRKGGSSRARAAWVREFGGVTKNAHMIMKINQGLIDPVVAEDKVCALDDDAMILA